MAKVRSDRTHPLPSSFDAACLFDAHEGSPLEARALLVKLLVKNPETPVAELAEAIERSAATTRRYLRILREEGVDVLLRTRRAMKLSDEEFERVKAMILSGAIASQRQLRDWIEQRSEVRYTASGVSRLLKREAPVARRIGPQRRRGTTGAASDASDDTAEELVSGSRLLEFVNGLSSDLDPHVWSSGLKSALGALLPGDPVILITLNTSSELDPQKPQRPGVRMIASAATAPTTARARIRASTNVTVSDPDEETTIRSLRRAFEQTAGIDHDRYGPPLITPFFLGENIYLGSIALHFRLEDSSHATTAAEIFKRLAPFLRFCLSDGITRQRFVRPERRLVQQLIDRCAHMYGLADHERRVFMLHVVGIPYKEIAKQLKSRPNTIKNQITAIHRKTDTTSQGELLRKIFVLDSEPEIVEEQPRPPV